MFCCYVLSDSSDWSFRRDLNSQSDAYRAPALPLVLQKHLVREDGHYPAVTFKDTCALNPFRVPWLEHGCLFLHTLSWCLIRGSNPGKTDFESAMSAICINQTYRSDETVAILLFGYLFSCTEISVPTSFCLSSVLALARRLELRYAI